MEISKLKNTITEIKNLLSKLNSRLEIVEKKKKNQITNPKDRWTEINVKRRKKLKKNGQRLEGSY